MLALFAVRRLIHEAAGRKGTDPGRLSFLHTVNAVRRRIPHPGGCPPEAVKMTGQDILDQITEERAVSSQGQVRPRGVKRKTSSRPVRSRRQLSRKVCGWIPEIYPVSP